METYIKLPLDDPLGSLMLAVFVSCMLYSHEVVLMFRYFRTQPWKEHPILCAVMGGLLCNDSYAMANEIYIVYTYCISNWGNIAYLSKQPWTITLYCVTAGLSTLACQGFLVLRVHKLGKNWLLTVPLALATATAIAGALWAAYVESQIKLLADRARGNAPISTWLIVAAVGDAGIALVLLALLWRARKVASQFEGSNLVGPLTKMRVLTIETGGLTAVIAVIALGFYVKDPSSKIAVGLGFVLGRLYALTILFCLRQRGSAQREATLHSSGHNLSAYQHKSRTVGGVSVSHQATVVVEDRDAHELSSFAGRAGPGQRKPTYVVGTPEEDELDEKTSFRRTDLV